MFTFFFDLGDTGHAFYMVICGVGAVKTSKKAEITDNFVISKPAYFLKVKINWEYFYWI